MKKTLLTLALVTASVAATFAQGRVNFDNISGAADATVAVTVRTGAGQQIAGEGAAGAFVGGDAGQPQYSIQLLWGAPGATFPDLAAFLASSPSASPAFAFIGQTGGGPTVDGAGLYNGGTIPSPVGTAMPAGTYQMVARAWFNGGGTLTFAQSLAANHNTGYSAFQTLTATVFPATAPTTSFAAFTVGGAVPEPSTFALVGLGMGALVLIRRKK